MPDEGSLLSILRTREHYNRYFYHINTKAVTEECKYLLFAIKSYFDIYPANTHLNKEEFLLWFTQVYCRTSPLRYKELLESLFLDKPGINVQPILQYYDDLVKIEDILNLINQGKSVTDIRNYLSKLPSKASEYQDWVVPFTVESLLAAPKRQEGLKWRLNCLQNGLGGVTRGDFIVVGAGVGVGKTGFITSEATHLARYLPEDKKVLWLNNEGSAHIVQQRIVQATLNITQMEFSADYAGYFDLYNQVLSKDKIKLINITRKPLRDILNLIESERDTTGLIVIDMIDNFFTSDPPDAIVPKLKWLYDWLQAISIDIAPVLGTTQLQKLEDPFQKRYPPLEAMQYSNIGKQGAAQISIMIGQDAILEKKETEEVTRFISVPKNKVGVYIQEEVLYNIQRMRYRD